VHAIDRRRFAYDLGQVILKVIGEYMPDQVIPQ